MALLDRLLNRQPKLDHPRSDSGRAHYGGFLDYDETNVELRGQAGLEKFDKMFRSDHDIRRNVMMVVNSAVSASWSTEPFGGDEATDEDKQIADDFAWALGLGQYESNSPLLTPWAYHLAEFLPVLIRSGFTPGEVWWTRGKRDGRDLLTFRKIGLRLPRTIHRWVTDDDGELTAIEQFRPSTGGYVTLPRQDLVYYRVGVEGDNWEGISMLRPVYKAYFIKDKVERLDAQGIEREAVGLPVVYPPKGKAADQGTLDDIEDKLAKLREGSLAYFIAPGPSAEDDQETGWRFEIMGLGGEGGGGKRDAQPSLQYWRDAISAGFIEEFMRLGQGGAGSKGALSTAEVQDDPFTLAVQAFMKPIIAETLQILARRFVTLNHGPDKPLPTLTMSVSEDSLAEFAAGVAPLVTAGLINPDDPLEDFLRQRGKLPPADPKQRAERKQAEQDAAQADLNAKKAGATTPAAVGADGHHEAVTETRKPDGTRTTKREKTKTTARTLNTDPAAHSGRDAPGLQITTPVLGECEHCGNHHDGECEKALSEPRDWEAVLPVEHLEHAMDTAAAGVQAAALPHVHQLAAQAAVDAVNGRTGPGDPPEALTDAVTAVLHAAHAAGEASVTYELDRQRLNSDQSTLAEALDADTVTLARRLPRDSVARRGYLIAKAIVNAVTTAAQSRHISGATDLAAVQAAGEIAGDAAAKAQGAAHAAGALNQGRGDAADQYAHLIRGARYTSILDRNRCTECATADDGVLRALADPVRLARRPPNIQCRSILSGENRCRCMEFYELNDEAPANLEASGVDAASDGDPE